VALPSPSPAPVVADHLTGADEITISTVGPTTADIGDTVTVALAITTSTNPHVGVQWEIAYTDNLSYVSTTYDCQNPAGVNYPSEVHANPTESAYVSGYTNLGNLAFCESLSVAFPGATFTGTFVTVDLQCDSVGLSHVFIRPKNEGGNPANDASFGTTLYDFTAADITTTLENAISVPSFGTQAGVTVTCSDAVDLSVVKSAPATALTTDTDTYSLTVNNPDAVTRQADVTDAAPAGVTFTAVSHGGCSLTAALVECLNISLPPGDTVIDIDVTFDTCGTKDNTATVALVDPSPPSVHDPNSANDSSLATTTLDCPVLTVTKDPDVTTADGGTDVTYTITVENDAGSPATDVTITDPLGGATLAAGSDADCSGTTTAVCGPRFVAGGADTVFTVVATMPEPPGVVSNTAAANATGAEEAFSNQVDVTVTSVKSNIVVTKVDNMDPVEWGGRFSYTVRARNMGPVPAKGLWVVDFLPDPSETPNRGDTLLLGVSVSIDNDGDGSAEISGLACTPGASGPFTNPNPPPAAFTRAVICSITPTLQASLPVDGSAFIHITLENHTPIGATMLNAAQSHLDGTYGESEPTLDLDPANTPDCAPFTSVPDNFGCEATLSAAPMADLVIGQASFSGTSCNRGLSSASAITLCTPWGVAFDGLGNLFVADTGNNRVLVFRAPYWIDTVADAVVGQPDLTSRLCNGGGTATAATLCSPNGITLDAAGNLYVADTGNHRVLRYENPLTADATADTVYGQLGSFTTTSCNPSGIGTDTLCGPNDVTLDAAGNLYVADGDNNRALEYDVPLTPPLIPGATADRVYGQGLSFTGSSCNNGGVSASSLCSARAVSFDSGGALLIADDTNGRVLRYVSPLSDAIADSVYGQPNFTSAGCAVSATRMCFPFGVDGIASGDLMVADYANSRVLRFDPPLSDATADHVMGHFGSFASGTCNAGIPASAVTLCLPRGTHSSPALHQAVSDTGNHRVLLFEPSIGCGSDFDCDGIANANEGDDDTDGVADGSDNCLGYNPDQLNTDAAALDNGPNASGNEATIPMSDAFGDACDDDDDNDGRLDAVEATGSGCAGAVTAATDMDTDGDHLTDGWECANGSNPLDPGSKFLGSGTADTDGDRVLDLWEQRGYGITPGTTDADGDGCHDMVEVASIDGNKALADADRIAVARRALGIWGPHTAQDYVLDIDRNGTVADPDRIFVARAVLLPDWLPKSCP
jgi:uncharacterized repeat protein (TIGR01451 family)